MGSPLSPVLANLCMEFVEKEILSRCDPEIKPVMWVRYVDDIFILFKGNGDQLRRLVDFTNSILPSIKFTTEIEVDFKLAFLDVLVIRDPISNTFKFSVYRKSTNSECYIHFYSGHSKQIKSNVIMNFALRALRICEPEYIDSEIQHISATFRSLRYPQHFIEQAISKARKNYYGLKSNAVEKPKRYLSLPFNPKIENVCNQVNRSQKETKVVFKYDNTLKRKLMKNNNNNANPTVPGVYEIPCMECKEKYFGESGRGLPIRITEHKRAYDNHAQNSAIVSHSYNRDHQINWNRSKIIFKSRDVHIRRLIEGAAINVGESFKGNKSFVNEDPFVNYYLINNFVENFDFKNSSVFPNPDAAVLPLPTQVTTPQRVQGYGAYPVNPGQAQRSANQPVRRSRRIAERNAAREGIT